VPPFARFAKICKILGIHENYTIRANRRRKIPLFSMGHKRDLQIFKNIFLGVSGNLKGSQAKKFGFAFFRFRTFASPHSIRLRPATPAPILGRLSRT
jgi:hypothetical protein